MLSVLKFFFVSLIVLLSVTWIRRVDGELNQLRPFNVTPATPPIFEREYSAVTRLVGTNDYFLIGGRDRGANRFNDVYRTRDFDSVDLITEKAAFPVVERACAGSIFSTNNHPLLLLFGGSSSSGFGYNRLWFSNNSGSNWYDSGFNFGEIGSGVDIEKLPCIATNKEKEFLIVTYQPSSRNNPNSTVFRFASLDGSSLQMIHSYDSFIPARTWAAVGSSGSSLFIAGGMSAFRGYRRMYDVWFSSDAGYSWTMMNSNAPFLWDKHAGVMIYGAMYVTDMHYSSGKQVLWKSTDGGKQWESVNIGSSIHWMSMFIATPLFVTDASRSTVIIGSRRGNGFGRMYFYSGTPSLPSCSNKEEIWDYSLTSQRFQCIPINDPSVYPPKTTTN